MVTGKLPPMDCTQSMRGDLATNPPAADFVDDHHDDAEAQEAKTEPQSCSTYYADPFKDGV